MTDDRELDVDELRAELDQIKDAMGIGERYAGATSLWLLFGLSVPVAAALSQYVHLAELPAWYHTFIWAGVFLGAFAVYYVVVDRENSPDWSAEGKPNVALQFAVVYFATIPLQSIATEYVGDVGYEAEGALVLSVVLVMLGVGYAVIGASLRAFYVRRRDRSIFYVGAVWMIALGTVTPGNPTLERWAFAAFGGIYFLYAMVAYVAMGRGGGGDHE